MRGTMPSTCPALLPDGSHAQLSVAATVTGSTGQASVTGSAEPAAVLAGRAEPGQAGPDAAAGPDAGEAPPPGGKPADASDEEDRW